VGKDVDGRVSGEGGSMRRIARAAAASILALLLSGLVAAPAGALWPPPPPPPIKVIVQQLDPNDPAPAALVATVGGQVTQQLPIITGFAATIPSSALSR